MLGAPEPLESSVPVDPEIIAIIGKALEKDPDNRYQDLTGMRPISRACETASSTKTGFGGWGGFVRSGAPKRSRRGTS